MMPMDDTPNTASHLLQILNQENEQAQKLLALLEHEYQLLKSNPGRELEEVLAQKKQLLKSVEQSVSAHHRFLQQQGLSRDRQGTERYLEQHRHDPSLTAAWERYLELLQACHKQNEINGGAVALNQRQVNQALNLLLGMGDGNKTYGRSGETRPNRPSSTLGKA
jgi:flagellar biosynthesis/type III secretory pathway chaperone